jgi:hypothetical protein
MKRGVAAKKKAAPKKTAVKRAAPKPRRSPLVRVKQVAQEVVQQATTAVSEGVEAIKDISETIVDRVTT